VSTTHRGYRIQGYRMGSYRGGQGLLIWRSRLLPGHRQAGPEFAPYETRTVVAPWRRTASVDTTRWEPGLYIFKLSTGSGWETQLPYIVTSTSAAGTVALVAPVTTWQAYNRWGGYSLYTGSDGDRRSWAVSFDRPYEGVVGANDFRLALVPVVAEAEEAGVPLSYFANTDLHHDPGALSGASGYLSIGHDEYWTPQMRDEVIRARDSGTNLAFLGANTMYWRVRLEDRSTGPGRLMTGYRHDAHLDPMRHQRPAATTARWRDPPAAEPENDLLGMLYECYPVRADYRVVSPRWWGFRGTGVRSGTVIRGLVGPESDRVYPDARTPRPLQVLSHDTIDCRGVPTSSQSVYYTTRSGAGVFAAGTLHWGCVLVDQCFTTLDRRAKRFVEVVTRNLVTEFADGPVGHRHPAQDNLDRFDLPTTNHVEAS